MTSRSQTAQIDLSDEIKSAASALYRREQDNGRRCYSNIADSGKECAVESVGAQRTSSKARATRGRKSGGRVSFSAGQLYALGCGWALGYSRLQVVDNESRNRASLCWVVAAEDIP